MNEEFDIKKKRLSILDTYGENFLNKNLRSGDVALFKASNGMKFFEIIEKLK